MLSEILKMVILAAWFTSDRDPHKLENFVCFYQGVDEYPYLKFGLQPWQLIKIPDSSKARVKRPI